MFTNETSLRSTFLAVKYGSAAMKITSEGKLDSEGSIIMTASGTVLQNVRMSGPD
jgi:hypothetical protein